VGVVPRRLKASGALACLVLLAVVVSMLRTWMGEPSLPLSSYLLGSYAMAVTAVALVTSACLAVVWLYPLKGTPVDNSETIDPDGVFYESRWASPRPLVDPFKTTIIHDAYRIDAEGIKQKLPFHYETTPTGGVEKVIETDNLPDALGKHAAKDVEVEGADAG
jgi:hypothetical protein